jgi:hypothetical protein
MTLATGLTEPFAIAVDSTSVYVADGSDGTVRKLPLAGGTPATLSNQVEGGPPRGFAVGPTAVYWGSMSGLNSALDSVPIEGGATTSVPAGSVDSIATDESRVYWADYMVINSALVTGGPVVPVITGVNDPQAVVVDATNVYWSDLENIYKRAK